MFSFEFISHVIFFFFKNHMIFILM
jgi:hypothetical protein